MFGIYCVNKPFGPTSHQIVNAVRRKIGIKKCGHTGTLDPFASGVLPVVYGSATRLIQYLQLEPKEYIATIKLGVTSTTYDMEGELTIHNENLVIDSREVSEILKLFTGRIVQYPPIFSAVKVKGKALYRYARDGDDDIEIPSREVEIFKLDIISVESDVLKLKIECSSGTYIRSLAHDIGSKLGCGACLSGLMRTRVGPYHIDDAIHPDDIHDNNTSNLMPALDYMNKVILYNQDVICFNSGRTRPNSSIKEDESGDVLVLDSNRSLLGIGSLSEGYLKPSIVINASKGCKLL